MEQLERLTPYEFELLCRGWAWRRERWVDDRTMLQLTIINAMGGETKWDSVMARPCGTSEVPGYDSPWAPRR